MEREQIQDIIGSRWFGRSELDPFYKGSKDRAGRALREWRIAGYVEVDPDDKTRYRFTSSAAGASPDDPPVETTQTTIHDRAPTRAREDGDDRAAFWNAGLIARAAAALVLALVVLAGAFNVALNWQPTVVEAPRATPAITRIIVTATPAPARTIPSFHAPGGEYAGDVPLPDPGDVIARYGAAWVNVGEPHAARWVRAGDWIGVDMALVPDLQPTPTPRVQIIRQPVPALAAPALAAPALAAPVPTSAPAPPTAAPAPDASTAAPNVIAERTIDPGNMTLACNEAGCICTQGIPDGNDLVIVLAGISKGTCEREAGW